jgi:DNA polymerase I-like protein with 3'-5' exonuclease and polymerase domains
MFQDLKDAKQIAIDIETYDPDLRTKGCGARRNGYICGVSIATDTGVREYYSVQHEGDNLDSNEVFNYLAAQLNTRTDVEIIGANILYDLEYLYEVGVRPAGKIIDVLLVEPLIDENQFTYSLESVALKYLGETKKLDVLEAECKLLKYKGDPRAHIYKFSGNFIRDYAIGDVDLPLRIWAKQKEILEKEDLQRVCDIERRLIPLLLQMKRTGCRIDTIAAEKLRDELIEDKKKLLSEIKQLGLTMGNTHADKALMAKYFTDNGIAFAYTEKTNQPKFDKSFLASLDLPGIALIAEAKDTDKLLKTIDAQILKMVTPEGRIHAQFNQLRGDDGGTVTGRFSSSVPNLQNLPNPKKGSEKSKALSKKCRALFLPEEGELYGSIDYSQIEYRLLCHFAIGDGSLDIQRQFKKDPKLDIHQWCADAAGFEGKEGREKAKAINFGIIYGQGVAKTALALKTTKEQAKEFLNIFDTKMPFSRATANIAMSRAQARGWVKTILGRRRRFPLWEPAKYSENKESPLPLDEAKAKWGGAIKRAGTYKALNAIVQGSSADLMKIVMVEAYEQGLFEILTPLTTVHDELNVSVPQTEQGQKAFDKLIDIMQNTYTFKIPILVEARLGKNWSEAK